MASPWDRPTDRDGVAVPLRGAAVSGRFRLVLRRATVFPSGVELFLRARDGGLRSPPAREAHWYDDLEMAVTFADGRRAGLRDSAGMKSGRGPVLALRRQVGWHGTDDRTSALSAQLWLWIWPLPPPGQLTVSCTWPALGVATVRLDVDATALRHALPVPPVDREDDARSPARSSGRAPVRPTRATVPDVVGMEATAARALARDALLFLEHADPDGPPLASGRVVRQEPAAGTSVPAFSRVVAWVTGEAEGPPWQFDPWPGDGPDDPGGGGGPPGSSGDREPRSPHPRAGHGAATRSLDENLGVRRSRQPG